MAVDQPFVTPGQCPQPDCELTLKFDDQSCLYVCKHSLIRLGDHFKTMLLGQFKERDQTQIEIQEVSRSDMLLFLQFTIPVELYQTPKPSNITEISTLIALADRFLYPKLCQFIAAHLPEWAPTLSPTAEELCQLISLGDRLLSCDLNQAIAKHILCTEQIYNQSSMFKLALVEVAYKHSYTSHSSAMLDACIRLCANLEISEVAKLNGKVSSDTLLAIHDLIGKATPKIADAPKHNVRGCHNNAAKKFDCLKITSDRHWWWHCNKCNNQQEATLSFEKIMQLEVKKSSLKNKATQQRTIRRTRREVAVQAGGGPVMEQRVTVASHSMPCLEQQIQLITPSRGDIGMK